VSGKRKSHHKVLFGLVSDVDYILLFFYIKLSATYCMQVPALEYNNEIKGESLDLVKFFSENFEGPSLYPDVWCLFISRVLNSYSAFSHCLCTGFMNVGSR